MRLATLSFCNDIDFADWSSYQEVHRCLREEFGLAVEDSFWLFDPLGSEMALFKTTMRDKGPYHNEILADIRDGRLTILHAGGNFDHNTGFQPSRGLLAEGLDYLRRHAQVPAIWTNHGDEGNVQNIGWAGGNYQQGDAPSSDAFILDILLQHGVRFFWTDQHTSNDFVFAAPGRPGQKILRKEMTRAGFTINGFARYRGPLPKAPDAETLGKQISQTHVEDLIAERGDVVIYQHWCVHRTTAGKPLTARAPIFPSESHNALRMLARFRDRQQLRVLPLLDLLQEHALLAAVA